MKRIIEKEDRQQWAEDIEVLTQLCEMVGYWYSRNPSPAIKRTFDRMRAELHALECIPVAPLTIPEPKPKPKPMDSMGWGGYGTSFFYDLDGN